MIRLLVVDDHPVVREGLVAVLEDEPDFAVVASTGTADDAVTLAARYRPDVILLDLELDGQDGVAALPRLLGGPVAPRVLVFTAYDADERVFGALEAGAAGYLLKGARTDEIARAIREVAAGGSYLTPRVAAKVVARVGRPRARQGRLSAREREVLRLVAAGQSNKQIARALGIAERTVKFHVTSLFQKLGADNRAQAVARAAEADLL
ncbi:MAG TPA: response regulator transcription factor [Chloroflexota bacterium]